MSQSVMKIQFQLFQDKQLKEETNGNTYISMHIISERRKLNLFLDVAADADEGDHQMFKNRKNFHR